MREQNASIWHDCHIYPICYLQYISPNCFNKKIINNSLEPFSSWVISQAALGKGAKGKMFTEQKVRSVNYDHDYFILERGSITSYFCHSGANNGNTDHLPELCSSVYTFTFNKTVRLLWQLEVYRVCFKTCAWQFMCINPLHTDMKL